MKVYTRGGDQGETSLFGGARVRKDDARIWAYGEVDELNSAIGLAAADLQDPQLTDWLTRIQSTLFDIGSELATPDIDQNARRRDTVPRVTEDDVLCCEAWIDQLDEELEPLTHFVLPGGTRAAAGLHLARTICRRAERRIVALSRDTELAATVVHYLNRLSDLLFVLARVVNARAGVSEPRWIGHERAREHGSA